MNFAAPGIVLPGCGVSGWGDIHVAVERNRGTAASAFEGANEDGVFGEAHGGGQPGFQGEGLGFQEVTQVAVDFMDFFGEVFVFRVLTGGAEADHV